jgi:hypothetical protein
MLRYFRCTIPVNEKAVRVHLRRDARCKMSNLCSEYSEIRARLRKACRPSFTSSYLRCDGIRPLSRSIIHRVFACVRNVFSSTKSVCLQYVCKTRYMSWSKVPGSIVQYILREQCLLNNSIIYVYRIVGKYRIPG